MDEEALPKWTTQNLVPTPLPEEAANEHHLLAGKQASTRALAHHAHHVRHRFPQGLADELGCWSFKDVHCFGVQIEEAALSIEENEPVTQALDHTLEIFGSNVPNHDPEYGSRAGRTWS